MQSSQLTESAKEDGSFKHPFTFADADVILRSSDGVNFKVHRLVLSLASPFFRDLFTLPQTSSNTTVADCLPVIPMSEAASLLSDLLQFIYPFPDLIMDSFSSVTAILKGGDKYQLQRASSAAQKQMLKYADSDPIRVYALGCYYKVAELAQAGARASRRFPSLPEPAADEFQMTSSIQLWRLIKFHETKITDLFANQLPSGSPSLNEDTQTISWNTRLIPHWRNCPYCPKSERTGYGTCTFWWQNYVDCIAKEVKEHGKNGDCATDPHNMAAALHGSALCPTLCGMEASVEAFRLFSQFISKEIDTRYKIDLDF